MNANLVRAAVCAALATFALAACDREPGDRTVGQKIDTALDKTKQELAVAGQKTKQELAEAGEKTKQALSTAGEKISETTGKAATAAQEAVTPSAGGSEKPMSDTAITASIKTDFLKDPDLSVLKIDVDTKGGVVTLNGLAANEEARVRAAKLASAVKGVKEVRNFLVIKRA